MNRARFRQAAFVEGRYKPVRRLTMSSTTTANRNKDRHTQGPSQKSPKKGKAVSILEIDPNGWVTIRLPGRLLRTVLIVGLAILAVLIVVIVLSPDFAAKAVLAIIQLAASLPKPTK
jgi:hypothetical protein